jgi:preprotein translocase subunit Sss1
MNRQEVKDIAKATAIGYIIGLALLIPFYIYLIYSMLSLYY